MDVCMDSRFHHSYMDWGYYGIFIISDELNGRQERGDRLLLSFLCSKTHIFCLKLYAIFLLNIHTMVLIWVYVMLKH